MNKGICKAIDDKISEGAITYDDLCKHFKQYKRSNISAALCTINRTGMLGKEGGQNNRTYFKLDQPREVRTVKKKHAAPTAYRPSVFLGELGKSPTVFKRESHDEVMQLRMMTRC